MKLALIFRLSLLLILSSFPAFAGDRYDRFFTNLAMRVDYYHGGIKGQEDFSLDIVSREGDWPGSRTNLIDSLNLGEYLVRVFDQATGEMIYSRGYSTMFSEWQTTDEASAGIRRTFSESIRAPYPKRSVQLTISRRDKQMMFRELWSISVNPNDPSQVRKEVKAPFTVGTLMDNGSPEKKVDLVILGDGYSKNDMEKFRSDAKHFNKVMFETEPFKSRAVDFNVRYVEVESKESGIDIPDQNVWKNNALGTSYNTFGSARYVLTLENKALRDAAASVPYDFICILVNDTRYGGGGIYNLYATTYTKEKTVGQEWQMDYVYVHEFGHSFAGLGDEYYTSSTAYNDFYPQGVEPWEPNVTAHPTRDAIKWSAMLTQGVELPTPWEKAPYDSIEALRGKLNRLAPDYYEKREPLRKAEINLLNTSKYKGMVGAFEGAGYASRGLYRPALDCRMFSLSLTGFDPVCSAAIDRTINFYSK